MVRGSSKETSASSGSTQDQPPPCSAPATGQSGPPPSLLDLIPVADEESIPHWEGSTFFDPQEVILSHDLLTSEVEKFGLEVSS